MALEDGVTGEIGPQAEARVEAQPEARVTVVGLGPGPWDLLTVRAARCLEQAPRLILRTGRHPLAGELSARGIAYTTFDEYYERYPTFDEVYRAMAEALLDIARSGPVVYAVPGHPLVAETSVRLLLDKAAEQGIPTEVVPSTGSVEALWVELGVDPVEVGAAVVDAHEVARSLQSPEALPPPGGRCWERHRGYVVLQLDSPLVVHPVKAALAQVFGDGHRVALVRAAGGAARVEWMPLYRLDRVRGLDHETALYVPPAGDGEVPDASELCGTLVRIMAALRSPTGCPWDRKQTHESLRRYILEEAYEAVWAIERGDLCGLKEELGDLLLQVLFQAQLASEEGEFSLADVEAALRDKLVRRHPHVFGEAKVKDAADVLRNWEAIKEQERRAAAKAEPDGPGGGRDGAGEGGSPTGVMDDLAANLPALAFAEAVQKRAARVGFEWPDISGAGRKAVEEARELRLSWARQERTATYRELGDLLFAIVNVARYMKVDPELALRDATLRFVRRFRRMEQLARQQGRCLGDMNLEEMDRLWEMAKRELGTT